MVFQATRLVSGCFSSHAKFKGTKNDRNDGRSMKLQPLEVSVVGRTFTSQCGWMVMHRVAKLGGDDRLAARNLLG